MITPEMESSKIPPRVNNNIVLDVSTKDVANGIQYGNRNKMSMKYHQV